MTGKRLWLFVTIAVACAAIFVRLGIWQLHRRDERRARNALVLARLNEREADVASLPNDTTAIRFRRVRVSGVPDYDHELVYAARSYRGSPGVNLFTPVRIAGRDTAVLVNRGWVYAPDGASVDLAKWREPDTAFTGYVENLPARGGSTYSGRPRVIARLAYDAVARSLPYPVAPFYVVVLGDSAIAPDRLARLGVPPLDEGPHLNYAIQWFGFAVVALAGAGFVLRQASADRAVSAHDVPDAPAERG